MKSATYEPLYIPCNTAILHEVFNIFKSSMK